MLTGRTGTPTSVRPLVFQLARMGSDAPGQIVLRQVGRELRASAKRLLARGLERLEGHADDVQAAGEAVEREAA